MQPAERKSLDGAAIQELIAEVARRLAPSGEQHLLAALRVLAGCDRLRPTVSFDLTTLQIRVYRVRAESELLAYFK